MKIKKAFRDLFRLETPKMWLNFDISHIANKKEIHSICYPPRRGDQAILFWIRVENVILPMADMTKSLESI